MARKATTYKQIKISNGEQYFSVYCTEHSLLHRKEDVMRWHERLTEHLNWNQPSITITDASESAATERAAALFETEHSA